MAAAGACLWVLLGVHSRGLAAGQAQQQSPTPDPARMAMMQHHFVQVSRVHDAIIRGDLGGTLRPAAELAAMPTPPNLPIAGEPFLTALRQAARMAGTAPSLRSAAASTVTMLQQCAGCHQAAGVYPAPISVKRPDPGGIVGHMLEHQRAADDLLQALVIPSASLWQRGAERLATSSLDPGEWPPGASLRATAPQLEANVHALAARAATATTPRARAAVYAELLTACASCHQNVRGPRRSDR